MTESKLHCSAQSVRAIPRWLLLVAVVCGLCLETRAGEKNLALGKRYSFAPQPRYRATTDEDDAIQLTDGKTTDKHFWSQKGTVGWTDSPYVTITVDLQKVEPIGRIEMTTAAGSGWVHWPFSVTMLVSDCGETYRIVGNLVENELEFNGPWREGYAIRCLHSRPLNVRGRFVRLVGLPTNTYFFTDEIRVLRGDDACLAKEPDGQKVPNEMKEAIGRIREIACSNVRLRLDVTDATRLIEQSALSPQRKIELVSQIKPLHTTKEPITPTFRTIFPMNPAQRGIYEIVAGFWKEMGSAEISFGFANRWDPIERFCIPKDLRPPQLDVFAMRNETRAAAFNIYSTTGHPVGLKVEGVKELADLDVFHVLWTDSNFCARGAVASALMKVAPQADGTFSIPTVKGLAGQVYLKFRTRPGTFKEKKTVSGIVTCDGIRIPLTLTVYPLDFPQKTSLIVSGYDYLHEPEGSYAITPKNRDSFLKYAKSLHMNAPWAYSSVISDFTIRENGAITLNTKKFDFWHSLYPDTKAYYIYIARDWRESSSRGQWHGRKLGSPEFEKLVAAWIGAWEQHWTAKGIRPRQVYLMIADEPSADTDMKAIVHWARALNKASSEIHVIENPLCSDPTKLPPELINICDTLQPNRSEWMDHRQSFDTFYLPLKDKGKELQVYACQGPIKTQDPYSYILLQSWHVAQMGGTGSSFWAWADTSDGSDWNEYPLTRSCYSLMFYNQAHVLQSGRCH